ncbi:MAG: GNAT family N-acetyltransferase [Candidatus Rokuibacteriota bacterium]
MGPEGQITIRRYRRDDSGPLLEAALESTEQIFPWLPWCHAAYSLDDSHAWIEHCEAAWQKGAEYNFAIVDHARRILGGCGLNQLRPEHRVANLGYWVRTSATKKGVATAAVRELAEFAFRETNLVRLEIVVALGNVASHRVAAKVGAVHEGVAHDRLHVHGQSRDAVVYALLRSRYEHRGLDA